MSDATEIARLEEEWMQAWVRKDLGTCERLLADDFLLTSARGVLMPKADWIANATWTFHCERFQWEDIRVRLLGEDVAVVHGRSVQNASVGGQDWSGVFLTTDVWAKRDGRWQVVARHGTGPLKQA
jgi:uncharacterized protein (TIGR02246 family)